MIVTDNTIIVAGCEPIIRSYDFVKGDAKQFMGHRGWVYCLMLHDGFLYSGGDDNTIRIWDMRTSLQVETLDAHRNGVTSIVMCNQMIITASFDHYIVQWDYHEMLKRVEEKRLMKLEDIASRKEEVKFRSSDNQQKRGAKRTGGGAGVAKKGKKKK